ncbi:MAG: M20 family metallopeptidase [Bacillota bacterium]|nr:M20 family metallopeptidase [Bacillota bacterium]
MNLGYMRDIYEQLHKNPEVSLEEYWTANFIASELENLGFSVKTEIGGTGVVGIMEFAHPGKCLALRADMDGLPVTEKTGVAFASKNPGVMHACGHDSHMAILLSVCAYAAQNKAELSGSLIAVFQPAEEIVVGAKAMLKQGVFEIKKPDYFLGIHNWPSIPAGTVGLESGPVTSYADGFKVTFMGQGGHGAFPHKVRDPIAMATLAVQNAYALTQRTDDNLNPRTLSFGMIHGGTSFNVIPETVEMEGTVRTVSEESQQGMIELLHKAFNSSAELYGGSYNLEYRKGVPAVVNDPLVVEKIIKLLQEETAHIHLITQGLVSLIGEDVGYFLQEVPGALLFIGSGQEGAINELHNPCFLVPEETLHTGYAVLTSILRRLTV